jgi:hypothetical protein
VQAKRALSLYTVYSKIFFCYASEAQHTRLTRACRALALVRVLVTVPLNCGNQDSSRISKHVRTVLISQFEHLSYFAYSSIAILRISELVDSTVRTLYYCDYTMYEIKLIYPKYKSYEPCLTYKESITHCATVELFLRGIHTVQCSATRIAFESERDRTVGLLLLSNSDKYSVVCLGAE